MAESKIFAGPRIRRVRGTLGLTQTAMAGRLGISPSYLNLIERNQRPLTVQLILKMAEVFDLDLGELSGGGAGTAAELRVVFADPLLAAELPGDGELVEIAEGSPNVAAGIAKLYRAYREGQDRLSDLSALLAREGHQTRATGARLPSDEVQEVFENRPNHFPAIETAAETFRASLGAGEDLSGLLRAWLRREHEVAVRVLPAETMPLWRRRFDRHSRRLFVSERLVPADRLREVATEVALLGFGPVIAAEVETFGFSSAEAQRLARFELLRYAAHALMMPYGPFQAAAERTGGDIDVLAGRFDASFEQAATRLTTLQRQSAPGLPFFLVEIDGAGNRLRRAGARGFPVQRFGGDCPKLLHHAAFSEGGRTLCERVEMPDGASFLTIARTLEGPAAGFGERPRRTAILIGLDAAFAERTVYGRALGEGARSTPIGPACRLCERQGCLARAAPPLTRPLGLDEAVTGLGGFDFQ
ncbi:Cro/Cl family transcriptional regulator [Aureimonas sp. Leaf454]|uniref:helix-turn-helix domain-containing protein n=1 Tax=Aureimonas sp. Leaf454 TaxID=1736381 RepID=UPI0006FA17B9|nr:XRE family transcriptional regulator [Aureimonas sp. Leaf454]KQT52370.1 Cro/Cl family transcriptional regulator [Aureimonas sp. Leaf454]